MHFETDNQEIIELFEIYNFMKYYYDNVICDIAPSILKNKYSYAQNYKMIFSMLNKLEYNRFKEYIEILRDKFNVLLPSDIQKYIIDHKTKFYKIIKYHILFRQTNNRTNIIKSYKYNNYNDIFELHFRNLYAPNIDINLYSILFRENMKFIYNRLKITSDEANEELNIKILSLALECNLSELDEKTNKLIEEYELN